MRVLLVAAGLGLLVACTSMDPLTITDAPIGVNAAGRDLGPVIEGALRERGWQVSARRPGAIDAFVMIREHRADVTISYDADSYSINYRDSQNMNYNNGKIHRNYNRWVANLNNDIQRALAGLPPA